MQYNVGNGSTDHCSIPTSSNDGKCSVNLDRDEKTEVVLDVGNVPFHPGEIDIAVVLTTTLRKDIIGTVAGGVMGCAVVLAMAMILILHINVKNRSKRRIATAN